MSADTTAAPTTAVTRPAPGRVLAGLAARQIRRGALVVTVICAGMSALVVAMYHSQGLDPAAVAALARNPAIRTLFGEPVALDDPGGFTVWRTGTALAVLLGVWSLLAATRITRGEEDAGRWNLLLSGRATLPDAVRSHLAVLAVVPVAAGTATAAAMIAAGAHVTGSLLHGTGLASIGVSSSPSAGSPGSCSRPGRPPTAPQPLSCSSRSSHGWSATALPGWPDCAGCHRSACRR